MIVDLDDEFSDKQLGKVIRTMVEIDEWLRIITKAYTDHTHGRDSPEFRMVFGRDFINLKLGQ